MTYSCYDRGEIKESTSVQMGFTKDINNCKTACDNTNACNSLVYNNYDLLNGKSQCILTDGVALPNASTIDLSVYPESTFPRYCVKSSKVPNNTTLTTSTTSSPNANINSPATKPEAPPADKLAAQLAYSMGVFKDLDPKESDTKMSKSTIIWIILGVIFGVILMIAIAYFIYRSTRPKTFMQSMFKQ